MDDVVSITLLFGCIRVRDSSCIITGHMPNCRCKVSSFAQQISCYARPGISWLRCWRQWEAPRKPCPAARRWQICCPAPIQAIAPLLLSTDCAWLARLGRLVQTQKQTVNIGQAWKFCICILVLCLKHELAETPEEAGILPTSDALVNTVFPKIR